MPKAAFGFVQRYLALTMLLYDVPKFYREPDRYKGMGIVGSLLLATEGTSRVVQSMQSHTRATPGIATVTDLVKSGLSFSKGEWYTLPSYLAASWTNYRETIEGVAHHGSPARWFMTQSYAKEVAKQITFQQIAKTQKYAGVALILGSVFGKPFMSLFQNKDKH